MEAEQKGTIITCDFTPVWVCVGGCVVNPSLGSGLTGDSKTAFSDGLCIFYLPTFQLLTVEKHGTPYLHTHFLLIFPLQSLSHHPSRLSLFLCPDTPPHVARPKSFAKRDLSAHPSKRTHVERQRER